MRPEILALEGQLEQAQQRIDALARENDKLRADLTAARQQAQQMQQQLAAAQQVAGEGSASAGKAGHWLLCCTAVGGFPLPEPASVRLGIGPRGGGAAAACRVGGRSTRSRGAAADAGELSASAAPCCAGTRGRCPPAGAPPGHAEFCCTCLNLGTALAPIILMQTDRSC